MDIHSKCISIAPRRQPARDSRAPWRSATPPGRQHLLAVEEPLLCDLAVPDRVEPDLIHALTLAAGLLGDVHLEADDELLAVHLGAFDDKAVHGVGILPPFALAPNGILAADFCVVAHRL